ncbi:MAG: EamA family transporter [Actinobacteria bacterium HGW-Actinobacteria-2]|nr:MAG: EamA family transporter [Actinobacteria bacterium HGW-Actinobacteria-2]
MPASTAAASHAQRRLGIGIVLGLAASLAFAASGTFVRPLLSAGWTPLAAVFWRVVAASVLLLPLGFWVLRGRLTLLLKEWKLIVTFGVLAVSVAQGMYFSAVSRMSVSVALLLEYMAPVALVLLAWARQRHAPSRLVLGGAAASLAGLVFVLDLTGARLDGLGVLYGLGAMVGAAAYFVLGARPSQLPALALPAFGLPVGAVFLGILVATGVLPYAAPLVDVDLMGAAVPWWVPFGVVVLFATAAAYALGVAGVSLMGERLASFVSLSEVLFAALVAALVLGEVPTGMQLVGGVLIVVGVVLIRMSSGDAPAGVPSLVEEMEISHAEPRAPRT